MELSLEIKKQTINEKELSKIVARILIGGRFQFNKYNSGHSYSGEEMCYGCKKNGIINGKRILPADIKLNLDIEGFKNTIYFHRVCINKVPINPRTELQYIEQIFKDSQETGIKTENLIGIISRLYTLNFDLHKEPYVQRKVWQTLAAKQFNDVYSWLSEKTTDLITKKTIDTYKRLFDII